MFAEVIPQPPEDISCWRDGEHRSASVIRANLFTSDCKSSQCIWALDPSEMSSSNYRHYPFTGFSFFFFFLNEIKTLCISERKKCVYTTKWFHIWWNSSCHSAKTTLKCTAQKTVQCLLKDHWSLNWNTLHISGF